MKMSWTRGLSKEATQDVRANFKESLVIRKRLKEIITLKEKESHRLRRSKEGYSNPNWAYLQADASGYERCLAEIADLIE